MRSQGWISRPLDIAPEIPMVNELLYLIEGHGSLPCHGRNFSRIDSISPAFVEVSSRVPRSVYMTSTFEPEPDISSEGSLPARPRSIDSLVPRPDSRV
ncbi:hypothetical protein GW17_00049595 [Ensete ventricosum]|nr:hypothetical protein GW17_00049595 [Ensete ventricosum]RZS05468.1 hypothetical protein BHM03_00035992 [Ensete ventricosum]